MKSLASSRAARHLLVTSVLAQLPLGMLGIGLMVHAQRLTGSFAAAGLVTGVYAIAVGIGGPLLGALVDRGRQIPVLLGSAAIAAALLGGAAILPAHAPIATLLLLATGIGLATPPVGERLRAQLPALLSDPAALSGAYAFETSVVELCWVCGPPLVLGLGAIWSTGGALAISGLILLVATAAFMAHPAARAWRPESSFQRRRGGALRTPGMRTLTILLFGVGLLLGADEVAVTATARAIEGTTAAAAPLLALWGAGSFAGGLLFARLGSRGLSAGGLALLLVALTIGHLALIPAAAAMAVLGAVLFIAGGAIAPTEATVNAMVGDVAPPGTITEAFAWLAAAMAVGGAGGAALAGIVVDTAGATAAFALAGAAGALATLIAVARWRTLAQDPKTVRLEDAASGGAPCRSVS
ncbi:MAG: MFS transporter [Solirubrobacteraceae bacterium]